jgi:Transglycosylase SLT domain
MRRSGDNGKASMLPVALLGLAFLAFLLVVGAAASAALLFGGRVGCGGEAVGSVEGVPARLVPIYRSASARYGLGERGPSILAAVNWVETGFGSDLAVSSAEAEGWMQFLPSSWAIYGVDANGDGVKDPYNPWDAIFAAARLLRASGAPASWHDALFSYNHAEWYVEKVERAAEFFGGATAGSASASEAICAVGVPDEAVARMVAEADRLSALRPRSRYVWGGSHGSSPTPLDGPFDCSSAVSHLLQVGGFGNPTMDTTALVRWGDPGPGRWVTIFVKSDGPEAHTFIGFALGVTPLAERYWGTSGIVAPGKGPGWIGEAELSAPYLAGFELRHPPGL